MTTDSPMLSPPFPSPDNAVLRLVVGNAIASVRSGEASMEEAILHAAVHGTRATSRARTSALAAISGASYPNTATAADRPRIVTSGHAKIRSLTGGQSCQPARWK